MEPRNTAAGRRSRARKLSGLGLAALLAPRCRLRRRGDGRRRQPDHGRPRDQLRGADRGAAGDAAPGQAVPMPAEEAVADGLRQGLRRQPGDVDRCWTGPALERMGLVQVRVYEPWVKQDGRLPRRLAAGPAEGRRRGGRLHQAADHRAGRLPGRPDRGRRPGRRDPARDQRRRRHGLPVDKGGPTRIIFVDGVKAGANADQWIWSLKTIDVAMTAPASLVQPGTAATAASIVQVLLILVVLGATLGILRVVVQSNVLLGRMTTDVAAAQRRATNLSNTQRESLRLLQEITELNNGGSTERVGVRRGTAGPAAGDHDQRLRRRLAAAARADRDPGRARPASPGTELDDPARAAALRAPAMALVSQIEVRLKALYTEQEKYFYEATLQSLEAKADSERALVGLVSLVVVLGVCWVVLLKRRTRSDLTLRERDVAHRGGRAPVGREGAAGQRGALPLAGAARLRPHRGHRRRQRDRVPQPGGRADPRLPPGRADRPAAARARARRGPAPGRQPAGRAGRGAGHGRDDRAAGDHPGRPGADAGGAVPQPARRPGGGRASSGTGGTSPTGGRCRTSSATRRTTTG